MTPKLTQWLAAALVASLGSSAAAFCRATTCNRADPDAGCTPTGCEVTGKALFWRNQCISFAVQRGGSPKLGISAASLRTELERAFASWSLASCPGGGELSISLGYIGEVECHQVEYNAQRANANIVMFEDESWPYEGGIDTLATTRLRFNPDTGEIYDADIQINSAEYDISVGDPISGVDLESILAHEAGHFLALDHSTAEGATMQPGHDARDALLRSLEADDVRGVCAIYPPSRTASEDSCEPRNGFSSLCGDEQPPRPDSGGGCALAAERDARRGGQSAHGALAVAVMLGLLRRRRRTRRHSAG
ncbi:MAG TPA: matrixin family metalloprotease [Polyangiaceae bacterium]